MLNYVTSVMLYYVTSVMLYYVTSAMLYYVTSAMLYYVTLRDVFRPKFWWSKMGSALNYFGLLSYSFSPL